MYMFKTICCICGRRSFEDLCRCCTVFEAYAGLKCKHCGAILGGKECQLCSVLPLKFGDIKWYTTYLSALELIRAIKFKSKFQLCKYVGEALFNMIEYNYDLAILSPINQQSFLKREVNHLFFCAEKIKSRLKIRVISPLKKTKYKGKVKIELANDFKQVERVVFLDDVLTTGETLRQSLKILREKAKKVDAIFFAISNPNILSHLVFRARLNSAWNRSI